MNCSICGAAVTEGTKFCPNCGAPVAPQLEELKPDPKESNTMPLMDEPQPAAPNYTPVSSQQPAPAGAYAAGLPVVPQSIADSIQTWGIVGLICAFLFSILGIVFSAIAMSKAKRCLNDYGYLPQEAKTGRTLGIVGLVIGIVSTVIGLLVLIVMIGALAYGVSSYY